MPEKKIFPTQAADYDLLEEIGRGAFAAVHRALCKPLNLFVAIKRIDLESCNCSLESVGKEAHFMSIVDHPNVMKAYCSFNVDHFLWVVMPYMDGGSCLHIMKICCPDGLDETLTAIILKETLKGLDYLHRQQQIHRDIKAGNILIDSSGSVKLGDFGTSAYMFGQGGGERVRKTFTGTPCWMAPEVMEQKHGYDFRADIWSFGITALELAHGHAPFSKYPPMKILLMTIQNAPPTLDQEKAKHFSKDFREMVKLCLNKDPSKRPTTEKLLKHPFFKNVKSDSSRIEKLLHGLAPLWEREKILRDKDAALLASKRPAYLQEEERSRDEYKRGVSCWNFDVEILKDQAALEEDDVSSAGDDDDFLGSSFVRSNGTLPMTNQQVLSPSGKNIKQLTLDTNEIRKRSFHKQPRQIGRFGVFEGDLELESPGWHEIVRQTKYDEDQQEGVKLPPIAEDRSASTMDIRRHESHELLALPTLSRNMNHETLEEGVEIHDQKFIEEQYVTCNLDEHEPILDASRNMKANFDQLDRTNIKATVMRKNASNVSSVIGRKSTCIQDESEGKMELPKSFGVRNTVAPAETMPFASSDISNLTTSCLVPQLKSLLLQTARQYETLADMLKLVSPDETINGPNFFSVNGNRMKMEISDPDRESHDEVTELRNKVSSLTKELIFVKYKNVQLERQLNAIYNQHEEERMQREEAEKENLCE